MPSEEKQESPGDIMQGYLNDLNRSAVLSPSFIRDVYGMMNHVCRVAYENGKAEGRAEARRKKASNAE